MRRRSRVQQRSPAFVSGPIRHGPPSARTRPVNTTRLFPEPGALRAIGALFALILFVSAPAAVAQQVERAEEVPEFLKPPAKDLLRRGLQPLSADLPDTSVREGLLPPDASQGLFGRRAPTYDRGDQWTPISKYWQAPGIRYRPTYFADTMLERHGQTRHWLVQPLASGTRFFGSIAALPYGAVVDPPWRPASNLGHFRAGSGAPCMLKRPPLQVDAGLLEAGLVVGLIFIVP